MKNTTSSPFFTLCLPIAPLSILSPRGPEVNGKLYRVLFSLTDQLKCCILQPTLKKFHSIFSAKKLHRNCFLDMKTTTHTGFISYPVCIQDCCKHVSVLLQTSLTRCVHLEEVLFPMETSCMEYPLLMSTGVRKVYSHSYHAYKPNTDYFYSVIGNVL